MRPLRIQFRDENKYGEEEIKRLLNERDDLGSYYCEKLDLSITYLGFCSMCDGKCINCMHGNRCQVECTPLWNFKITTGN